MNTKRMIKLLEDAYFAAEQTRVRSATTDERTVAFWNGYIWGLCQTLARIGIPDSRIDELWDLAHR